MVDSCTIRHPSTRGAFDDASGEYASVDGALIYQGVCKRQRGVALEVGATAGDHRFVESRSQLHLPVFLPSGAPTPVIPVGAIATITVAPNDPQAVGRRLRIEGQAGKTWASALRFNVTEVVA